MHTITAVFEPAVGVGGVDAREAVGGGAPQRFGRSRFLVTDVPLDLRVRYANPVFSPVIQLAIIDLVCGV